MKILIVFSLLVLSAFAKDFSLHLVDPTVETTCNVSDIRIRGSYVWHDPERRERVDGEDYFEDSTHRRVNIGDIYRHTGPGTYTTNKFRAFYFFDDYKMVVNGNVTLKITARTRFDWYKTADDTAHCHKFEMHESDAYIKPGVPNIFTCQGNIYLGSKYPKHDDGLLAKICRYSFTTEERFIIMTVSSIKCYPVKVTDIRRDRYHRLEIVEEFNFFNWEPNFGDFPAFPPECWFI